MTRYKYTDPTQQTVARIDDDGKSRLSCTLEHPEFVAWLAEGNTPEPADPAPPPLTEDEVLDLVTDVTDPMKKVIFAALYELTKRVTTLEGTTTPTPAQFRAWLKARLQ